MRSCCVSDPIYVAILFLTSKELTGFTFGETRGFRPLFARIRVFVLARIFCVLMFVKLVFEIRDFIYPSISGPDSPTKDWNWRKEVGSINVKLLSIINNNLRFDEKLLTTFIKFSLHSFCWVSSTVIDVADVSETGVYLSPYKNWANFDFIKIQDLKNYFFEIWW